MPLIKTFKTRPVSVSVIFGFILSFVLLGWMFSTIEFHPGLFSLSTYDYSLFALSCLVFTGSVALTARRLRFLIKHSSGKKGNISTFDAVVLGNFYNNLLPGNLGEVIKLRHLSVTNKLSVRYFTGLWVIEKLVSTTLIAVITFILFFIYRDQFPWSWVFLLPFTLVIAGYFFLWCYSQSVMVKRALLWLLPTRWLKVNIQYLLHLMSRFHHGVLKRENIAQYYLYGLLILLFNTINHLLLLHLGGLPDGMASIPGALLFTTLSMFVYIIPAAPSSIGVFHFAVYSTLEQIASGLQIPVDEQLKSQFLVSSFLFYFNYVLPETAMGVYMLWKERNRLFTYD